MTDVELPKGKKQDVEDLFAHEADIHARYLQQSEKDFYGFIRGLRIDNKTPRGILFHRVIARHQIDAFRDLAPSLLQLKRGEMPDRKRHWWERTKKASKDADLALVISWLVAFPERPFYGQIGAGDREQAGIVKSRLSAILQLNPWLNDLIKIVGNQIRSTKLRANGEPMATFDVMSADVSGAHGGTPDLLIVNELSHITKWEFATNLMSNAAGVPNGIAIIATNAGIKGSEAHVWRKKILASKRWTCHVLSKPAPWHTKENVEDERSLLSAAQFNRLWKGVWVSGKGDAVPEEKIREMFRLDGPADAAEEGWIYYGGLDLGVSRDHAGFVILGASLAEKRIRLVHMARWDPKGFEDGKIWLPDVREHVIKEGRRFRVEAVLYDPHQAELMMQDAMTHIQTKPMEFTPKNCSLMANTFVQAIERGHVDLYDEDDLNLEADISRLTLVQKSYGLRLEATRDATGHADVATAFIIALPAVASVLRGFLWGSEDLISVETEEELTEDELEVMPLELREIFEMEESPKVRVRELRARDNEDEKEEPVPDSFESLFELE